MRGDGGCCVFFENGDILPLANGEDVRIIL